MGSAAGVGAVALVADALALAHVPGIDVAVVVASPCAAVAFVFAFHGWRHGPPTRWTRPALVLTGAASALAIAGFAVAWWQVAHMFDHSDFSNPALFAPH